MKIRSGAQGGKSRQSVRRRMCGGECVTFRVASAGDSISVGGGEKEVYAKEERLSLSRTQSREKSMILEWNIFPPGNLKLFPTRNTKKSNMETLIQIVRGEI